jgi:hypothetical protein
MGSSQDKGYFEKYDFDDGSSRTLGVIYIPEDGGDECICLYCCFSYSSGEVDYSYIFLVPEGQTYYSSYNFYEANNSSSDESYGGKTHIEGPGFSGRKNVVFEEKTGLTAGLYDQDQMIRLCMYNFCNSLYFTELVYQVAVQPNGAYSISDFGFDPNDLVVPD